MRQSNLESLYLYPSKGGTMSEEDVTTLRQAYEAFNRGDIEAVVQAFDPQIEWPELEGNPQASGIFRGTDSVLTGHFRGRPKGNGGTLDAHFAHVWRMRDGKAVHFTNYADTMMWARAMGRA